MSKFGNTPLTPGTETGTVNKTLKENLIITSRSSTLNFFIKFQLFSGADFLSFFTNLQMLHNSSYTSAPFTSASEPTVKAN
jgi:hypothetical protein